MTVARRLHGAASRGLRDAAQLLIQEGRQELLFLTDIQGASALHYAAGIGCTEIVRLLVAAGGQKLLFLTAREGSTALYCAAWKGHVDASRLLVDNGGKKLLAVRNHQFQTAEDAARSAGHGLLATILLRARIGKAGSNSGALGAARPCVSKEVEALAIERAAAAKAALLADEVSLGSNTGMAARGRKGKGGGKKK